MPHYEFDVPQWFRWGCFLCDEAASMVKWTEMEFEHTHNHKIMGLRLKSSREVLFRLDIFVVFIFMMTFVVMLNNQM